MTEPDAADDRAQVDPDAFETFDEYDPNLSPPEASGDEEDEADPQSFRAAVPPLSVEAAVGTLAAAYNKR